MKRNVFHLGAGLLATVALMPFMANGFLEVKDGFKIPDNPDGKAMPAVVRPTGKDRASAKFSKVYAYVHPGNGGEISLCELTPDFTSKLLWKPTFQNDNDRCWFTLSWINNGKICGLAERTTTNGLEKYAYQERSLSNGDLVVSRDIPLSSSTPERWYMTGAYVPSEDRVYGYTPGSVEQFSFCSAPISDITKSSVIKDANVLEYTIALCYNPVDDELYGVNSIGQFVRVGRDGTQSVIMKLDLGNVRTSVNGAMTYSPKDGKYLFQGYGWDNSAIFYWIDAQTKSCVETAALPEPAFFSCLLTPDTGYDEAIPGYGKFINPDFPNGYKAQGKVNYVLPKTTLGGNSLPSKLNYTIKLEENQVASGEAAPGDTVLVEITAPQRGYYKITGFASVGDKDGVPSVMRTFIGNDNPKNPEYVTLNPNTAKLTWTAPTHFVHGAEIKGDITYNVLLNGRMTNPFVKVTEYQFDTDDSPTGIDINGCFKPYWASVKASSGGQQSQEVSSDTLFIGKYMEIPFRLRPEKWESKVFTKNSNRPDSWRWRSALDNDPVSRPYFVSQETFDVLKLPVIRISEAQAGKTFRLQYDAIGQHKDVNLQVYISDDINNLVNYRPVSYKRRIKAEEGHHLEDKDFKTYETFFSVPVAGEYYLSFTHDDEVRWGFLYLSGISLEEVDSLDMAVPGYVNPMKVSTIFGKDMKIEVNFRMPEYLLNGEKMDATETLKAVVRNGDKSVTVEGKPGSNLKTEIEGFAGENTIIVYVERNGKKGAEAVTYADCGMDIPTDVTDFSFTYGEDPQEITVYWNKPTEKGFNGRYVNPDEVEYYFAYDENASTWLWSYDDELDLDNLPEGRTLIRLTQENGLKKDENGRFSYTYRRPEGSALPYRQSMMAVIPANEAGMTIIQRGDAVKDAQGDYAKYQAIDLGVPMQLPFGNPCTDFRYPHACGFYSTEASYYYKQPELWHSNYYAEANTFLGGIMGMPPLLDDNKKGTLYFYSMNDMSKNPVDEGSAVYGWSPFSTKGLSNAYINLELYRYTFSPEAEILLECYGMDQPESVATIAKGDRNGEIFHTAIRIPEKFMDKPWVRAYLKINFKNLLKEPKQVFLFGSYSFDTKSGVSQTHIGEGSVTSTEGGISISGYEGMPVSVYSLSGVPVYSVASASESENVTVPQGVYIVRAGSETVKIVVK